MKYEKPEVVMVAAACAAVQNHVKDSNIFFDILREETIGAYEADE
jgi:hypothetical protein